LSNVSRALPAGTVKETPFGFNKSQSFTTGLQREGFIGQEKG
jgi:hypothetical protein